MGIMVGQADAGSLGSIVFWGAIIIALLIGGFVVTMWLRRRMKEEDGMATPGGGGFTLSDLRELHAQGKLTNDEFEKAKHTIVEGMKAAAAKKAEAAKEQQTRRVPK